MGKKKDEFLDIEESEGTSLEDFVIPQKIEAFTECFVPAPNFSVATDTFNDRALREFFKAWPCTLGDPMTIYLSRLAASGFRMTVSLNNEPVIYVIRRSM